jgi:hypothetical protein
MFVIEKKVSTYRQFLSEIYEKESDYKKAANILAGIPLETSQKYEVFFFKNISTLSYIQY